MPRSIAARQYHQYIFTYLCTEDVTINSNKTLSSKHSHVFVYWRCQQQQQHTTVINAFSRIRVLKMSRPTALKHCHQYILTYLCTENVNSSSNTPLSSIHYHILVYWRCQDQQQHDTVINTFSRTCALKMSTATAARHCHRYILTYLCTEDVKINSDKTLSSTLPYVFVEWGRRNQTTTKYRHR